MIKAWTHYTIKVVQFPKSTVMMQRFLATWSPTTWQASYMHSGVGWPYPHSVCGRRGEGKRSGASRNLSSIHNVINREMNTSDGNLCLVSWEQTSCGNDSSAHVASEEPWSLSSEECTQSAHPVSNTWTVAQQYNKGEQEMYLFRKQLWLALSVEVYTTHKMHWSHISIRVPAMDSIYMPKRPSSSYCSLGLHGTVWCKASCTLMQVSLPPSWSVWSATLHGDGLPCRNLSR